MNQYNKQGQMHGPWETYRNGKPCFKGNYLNGKLHGLCESYNSNGQLMYKGNYVNGQKHGYWESYLNTKITRDNVLIQFFI